MICQARIDFEPEEHIGNAILPAHFIVHTTVTDITVDRPNLHGIGCKDRKTAERLVRAINAGKVFTFERIERDVNGKTFIVAGCNVWGRRLNADLKRLGF